MALRTPALYMGNPAVQHTAQNDRLMLAGLHRPESASTATNRPLTATSGVIAGPAGTMGEVTLLSNTQFTVNPGRWVVYSSASALGGAYKVANDAVETLSVTAQNASQYRKSYFGVWVIDSFVAGSGDDLPHWGIVDGALAASAGVAALPSAGSLPANFLALGEFLIPPVGQSVTWTPYDLRTGLRGSIVPVTTTDTRAPAYDGQYRDHPTLGLQRGKGGVWVPGGGNPQPVLLPLNTATWKHFQDQFPTTNPPIERLNIAAVGSEVRVRGVIICSAAIAVNATVFVCPPGTISAALRPAAAIIRRAGIANNTTTARIDVPTDGSIGFGPYSGGVSTTDFVAFDMSWSTLNNV